MWSCPRCSRLRLTPRICRVWYVCLTRYYCGATMTHSRCGTCAMSCFVTVGRISIYSLSIHVRATTVWITLAVHQRAPPVPITPNAFFVYLIRHISLAHRCVSWWGVVCASWFRTSTCKHPTLYTPYSPPLGLCRWGCNHWTSLPFQSGPVARSGIFLSIRWKPPHRREHRWWRPWLEVWPVVFVLPVQPMRWPCTAPRARGICLRLWCMRRWSGTHHWHVLYFSWLPGECGNISTHLASLSVWCTFAFSSLPPYSTEAMYPHRLNCPPKHRKTRLSSVSVYDEPVVHFIRSSHVWPNSVVWCSITTFPFIIWFDVYSVNYAVPRVLPKGHPMTTKPNFVMNCSTLPLMKQAK